MSRPLSIKQRKFVAALAAGASGAEAAVKAGYSAKSAKHIAHRLKQNDRVRVELAAVVERVRQSAVYDRDAAMAEAQRAMDLAAEHKQMTAYVKAVEHRARLSGLLVEKVDLNVSQTIDIGAALQEARARVDRATGGTHPLVIEGRARDVSPPRDVGSLRPMRDLPTGLACQTPDASGDADAQPIDSKSMDAAGSAPPTPVPDAPTLGAFG